MLEEPQLNGRIASALHRITESSGWTVREELKGALRGPLTKPDIVIAPVRRTADSNRNGILPCSNPPDGLHEEHRPPTGANSLQRIRDNLHGHCYMRTTRPPRMRKGRGS